MRRLVLLLSAIAITGANAAEINGTMDKPLSLTCGNLGKMIQSHAEFADSPVISGTMTVETEDDTVVPPVILGCRGDRHIICVTETPSLAQPGTLIGIAGRMSRIGQNYIMVDPCGVNTN